ncbi:MAG: hypothetical protein KF686_08190 [Ramlibacter sp.]|nr:hypothetical protein [Ramlibacter sp.]
MPRKPTPAPTSKAPAMNEAAIDGDRQAANQLAGLAREDAANVAALAVQLGYTGALDPDTIEQVARHKLMAAQQSIFEFGASLLLLRESCLHGDWLQRLDRIGISHQTAGRYMSIANKFKGSEVTKALTHLGMGKVLELTVLDDQESFAFAAGQSVRGITVDEVERMTLRELRAALREKTAENQANEELLADKAKRIDQLKAAQKRIGKAPPDQVLAELHKEATSILNDAVGAVRGQLRQALIALQNHDEDNTVFMAGLVGQLQADLAALREEFALPDVSNAADLQVAAEMRQWDKD